MSVIFNGPLDAGVRGRDAMTTTYLKAGRLTTVRAATFGRRRRCAGPLAVALLALAFGSTAASAQDVPPPVGMVDQPCVAAPPPAAPAATDAGVAAQRQAMMDRMRRDWPGLCRYRGANEALAGTPVRAVFIGDSITEFWEAAAPDLFREGVVNRGIGAQTSPQMLVRFYQDVIALKPDVVHIMAGTNDIAGNSGPSRPEDFKNNIRAMTEIARANDIRVVLGSIPPSARFYWRPELQPASRIAELNAWLREFARDQGAGFVDYAAAMAGPDGGMRPGLSHDGVHPADEGYAVMTPLAMAALAKTSSGSPGVAASPAAAPARPAVALDSDGTVHAPAMIIPPSEYMSPEGRAYLAHHLQALRRMAPTSGPQPVPLLIAPYVDRQKALYATDREEVRMGGVPTWIYTPTAGVAPGNADRVLINLHGGGFRECWPGCAELESMPIAALGRIRVVAVDYRQQPDHRFPAASEDVAAVYRELLKTYRPENIGLYGCSAGGMLTGMALAWFQQEGLPTPGAAGILCAGLTTGASAFGGDASYITLAAGEGRAPPPPPAPGAERRVMAYLADVDPTDPLASPSASAEVLARFPPTLVITGTRSFDLSAAVHAHAMLVKAGVETDLHVWEGMFHGFFYNPDVPESRDAYEVIVRFFNRYLGQRRGAADQ
ncbi:MAG: alpha/beta hydrolase fold domain-containing protein [Pseudomonadota bacterium]|nr:alpha/beta hydrolase fold domain-containing protein [Pseudomonadota bacterium]